jgi:hypothetical protein
MTIERRMVLAAVVVVPSAGPGSAAEQPTMAANEKLREEVEARKTVEDGDVALGRVLDPLFGLGGSDAPGVP